jgi:O-antigen ligase
MEATKRRAAPRRRGPVLRGRLGQAERVRHALEPLVPGAGLLALTLFVGFEAGGYFPGTSGLAAALVALALIVYTTRSSRPFEGLSIGLVVAVGAMGLFSVWTLTSAIWSDAPARALTEFDRALLYTLVLVAFGAVGRTRRRMTWLVRGAALAFVVISIAGLISRVLPDKFSIDYPIAPHRLSFPVTYWNAMGLICALAILFLAHLSSTHREPRALRVGAAALVPAVAATLVLTYSRGGIAAVVLGIVALLVIARPRLWLPTLIATAPTAAFASIEAGNADAISSATPAGALAVSEGHDLLTSVILCVIVAGAIRAALLPLDDRLVALRLPGRARRPVLGGLAAAAILAALVTAVAADAPGRLSHQYDRFVEGNTVQSRGNLPDPMKGPGNNGRLDLWENQIDSWKIAKLHGTGAGTFVLRWERGRPNKGNVREGHSLYLEVLSELGVVGLALVLVALGAIAVGVARRVRRPERELYGVVMAALVVWLASAAIDWQWEMPVVTIWVFALGGAALAAQPRATLAPRALSGTARLAVGMALLVIAATPALMWFSQHQLDNALTQWRDGNCARTIDYAVSASKAVEARPEPFVLIGFCDVRLGDPQLGLAALRNAERRDPNSWETHYSLALVQAVAGEDPRADAARSLELNPRSPLTQAAVKAFRGPRSTWERRARALPLPIAG